MCRVTEKGYVVRKKQINIDYAVDLNEREMTALNKAYSSQLDIFFLRKKQLELEQTIAAFMEPLNRLSELLNEHLAASKIQWAAFDNALHIDAGNGCKTRKTLAEVFLDDRECLAWARDMNKLWAMFKKYRWGFLFIFVVFVIFHDPVLQTIAYIWDKIF